MKTVGDLLERIGLDKIPRKVVLNKIDTTTQEMVENIAARYEAIPISATTGEGLNRLLDEVETALKMPKKTYGRNEIFEED
jgi:50S ribosomal subunit-associated GTPase HflX